MNLQNNVQKDLEIVRKAAKAVYSDNIVMQQLCICQAILESGILQGGSVLATKYNNLFGIKGKGIKTGRSVSLPTKEQVGKRLVTMKQDFAWNDSVEESFLQHKKILSLPRYKTVWKSKDLTEAAKLVRECGYATDRLYSKKLIDIYNRFIKG